MESMFGHEESYRGKDAIQRLADTRVTIMGVGALGSNLTENLVRQGVNNVFVLDKDRVERSNVGTQVYGLDDVGKKKVDALMTRLYTATDVEIGPVDKELDKSNVKRYIQHAGGGSHLVIDCFDNSASRQLIQDECRRQKVPCLHVGLFEGYAEVIWDENYTVPKDGGLDLCDYPLARNIIMLSVVVASEVVVGYLLDGSRRDFRMTLKDLKITRIS